MKKLVIINFDDMFLGHFKKQSSNVSVNELTSNSFSFKTAGTDLSRNITTAKYCFTDVNKVNQTCTPNTLFNIGDIITVNSFDAIGYGQIKFIFELSASVEGKNVKFSADYYAKYNIDLNMEENVEFLEEKDYGGYVHKAYMFDVSTNASIQAIHYCYADEKCYASPPGKEDGASINENPYGGFFVIGYSGIGYEDVFNNFTTYKYDVTTLYGNNERKITFGVTLPIKLVDYFCYILEYKTVHGNYYTEQKCKKF